jgi:hypothetical protein
MYTGVRQLTAQLLQLEEEYPTRLAAAAAAPQRHQVESVPDAQVPCPAARPQTQLVPAAAVVQAAQQERRCAASRPHPQQQLRRRRPPRSSTERSPARRRR